MPAVLGSVCDLRVVLPGALVLRLAVPASGQDLEPPGIEAT
jgi:hypothetical protein